MAEPQRSKNEELYESGDISPDLPDVVLDKIKKYHRIANAAIEPKRTVLMELKRMNAYADTFVRKLSLFETISPKFVADITRLGKIKRLFDKIGHREAEYLKFVLITEMVPDSFEIGKEGVVMDFKPFDKDEIFYDENNEPWRFG